MIKRLKKMLTGIMHSFILYYFDIRDIIPLTRAEQVEYVKVIY
jgi:hypothetical protein